jgi:hypothetical protein
MEERTAIIKYRVTPGKGSGDMFTEFDVDEKACLEKIGKACLAHEGDNYTSTLVEELEAGHLSGSELLALATIGFKICNQQAQALRREKALKGGKKGLMNLLDMLFKPDADKE